MNYCHSELTVAREAVEFIFVNSMLNNFHLNLDIHCLLCRPDSVRAVQVGSNQNDCLPPLHPTITYVSGKLLVCIANLCLVALDFALEYRCPFHQFAINNDT